MTATDFGEKNTSSGRCRLRFTFFFPGLLVASTFGLLVWIHAERGLVQGLDAVGCLQSVFAGHRFNIAVIAGHAVMEGFKDRYGFRMTLLDIADDHVTADQLIESKHRHLLGL